MPLRDYEAVWTFGNPAEPGVQLELEIFDSRRGDTVRLRRASFRGLLRRTLLAIQIETYKASDDDGRAPDIDVNTLRVASATVTHLRLRGWELDGATLNPAATNILDPGVLVLAKFREDDFRYVGDQLPFELRASLIEYRANQAQAQAA